MKKSEKIILSLVLVAALYAVVDFSMTRQKKKAVTLQAQTQADTQGIAELSAQLSALSSPADRKIDLLAASIADPWPETTFVLQQVDFGNTEQVEEPQDSVFIDLQAKANLLVYSGYLAMGSDLIALINGMDYRVGEQVNGFTVTKISKEAVQVSQNDATFTVPVFTEKEGAASATDPSPPAK